MTGVCVDVVSDGLRVCVVCDDVSPASGVGFSEFGCRGDRDVGGTFWEGGFPEGEDVIEMVEVAGVGAPLAELTWRFPQGWDWLVQWGWVCRR